VEEKLGEEAESTDSEDGVEEDEEGDELTPAADAAIFKTLAKIRDRDPVIYEKDVNVFQGTSSSYISWLI
jgi:protein KRI1